MLRVVFKTLLTGCAAVISIVVVTVLVAGVLKIPVAIEIGLSQMMAPDCEPPSEMPPNAGALVAVDVRHDGTGDRLVPVSPADWAVATTERIESSTDRMRDLVIYVHGFNTRLADARCIGEALRADLAQLPQYRSKTGPDIVVFGWPSEFLLPEFSKAQRNATRAAGYLGRALTATSGRRLYLVAHSLGAQVVMDSAAALPQSAGQPAIAGILLVGGAIPATSVRTWTSKVAIHFPAAELDARRGGTSRPKPIEYEESGIGEYVTAAAKAEHLVVTTAAGDAVLGQAYSLDELFAPDGRNRPQVPPSMGEAPRTLPQTRAIGSPFPSGPVYVRYDEVLRDPTDHSRPTGGTTLRPPDPTRIIQSTEWIFDFTVPHSSFHELPLDERSTRFLYYWHGPLSDPSMRHEVLAGAWAVYDSLEANRASGKTSPGESRLR